MAKLRTSDQKRVSSVAAIGNQPIPVNPTKEIVEVVKYVDKIIEVEKIVERVVETPVEVIKYIDRIVPRTETKFVDREVPVPVRVVEQVQVDKFVTEYKVPLWAYCTIAIQFLTIIALAWQG